ncbi:MAG: hypothetical protein AAF533_01415 [Acidobacteriota bacterium]
MSVIDWLRDHPVATNFTAFDWVIVALNVLTLVFSGRIARAFRPDPDEASYRTRVWALRGLNILLLALQAVAALAEFRQVTLVSQTGLTLLLAYLCIHFANVFFLRRYGRQREIEGETVRTQTYQSSVFSLIAMIAIGSVALLVIMNIWETTSWLKATSVLGGLLVALVATKDQWAPDTVSGLIILYNGQIRPGAVVRSDELDLLAIALRTTLTETTFKDLVQRHHVVVPNRRLREAKVEILSDCTGSGLWEYHDFNISYDCSPKVVTELLEEAWTRACAKNRAFNTDVRPRIRAVEAGDHAVQWRLFYAIGNVYAIKPARFAIVESALALAAERGIGLDTPLTHEVRGGPTG